MLISKDLIITLILALGISKISDIHSPKNYDLITSEGKTITISVEKNARYACPVHCGSDHYHKTITSDEGMVGNEIFYTLYGRRECGLFNIL